MRVIFHECFKVMCVLKLNQMNDYKKRFHLKPVIILKDVWGIQIKIIRPNMPQCMNTSLNLDIKSVGNSNFFQEQLGIV